MFPQSFQQDLGVLSPAVVTGAYSNDLTKGGQLVALGTIIYNGQDQARKGYRYVAFPTSTAFTAGELLVAAAAPSNSTGLALPTANTTAMLSANSQMVFVTNGSTAVTADEFKDGTLEVLGTNGIGQAYRIRGNSVAAASAQITVYLGEPLRNTTALANTTNTVNLRYNLGYLPTASTTQGKVVGVTIMPVASQTYIQYGWVQIYGEAYVNATSGTKGFVASQDIATTAGNAANAGTYTTEDIGVFKESAASSLASIQLDIR
jgi:hypothetical protein